jgi:hypothetical protein
MHTRTLQFFLTTTVAICIHTYLNVFIFIFIMFEYLCFFSSWCRDPQHTYIHTYMYTCIREYLFFFAHGAGICNGQISEFEISEFEISEFERKLIEGPQTTFNCFQHCHSHNIGGSVSGSSTVSQS